MTSAPTLKRKSLFFCVYLPLLAINRDVIFVGDIHFLRKFSLFIVIVMMLFIPLCVSCFLSRPIPYRPLTKEQQQFPCDPNDVKPEGEMNGNPSEQGRAWQGHAWWGRGDMHGRGHAWQERWPLQRKVHILMECILVIYLISQSSIMPKSYRLKIYKIPQFINILKDLVIHSIAGTMLWEKNLRMRIQTGSIHWVMLPTTTTPTSGTGIRSHWKFNIFSSRFWFNS